ncbi:hypothetical protein D1872_314850 [compost metagenome]
MIKRGVTTCLACLAPRRARRHCVSILGPAAGLLGLLEAMEVIKLVTEVGEPSFNKIVIVDALTPSIDTVEIKPTPCEPCRERVRAGQGLAAQSQAPEA